jgi:hypothetical protein
MLIDEYIIQGVIFTEFIKPNNQSFCEAHFINNDINCTGYGVTPVQALIDLERKKLNKNNQTDLISFCNLPKTKSKN